MSTFSQWHAWDIKHQRAPRIIWVCGSARVLVDEVVESTLSRLDLREWSVWRFVVGEDSEQEIFDTLRQPPLELEQQAVVVYGANRLSSFAFLENFFRMYRRSMNMHLILVSDSDRLEKTTPTKEERQEGIKPELLPHLQLIRAKGKVVECKSFTQATIKQAITWIRYRAEVSAPVAVQVIHRTNGDLQRMRDLCEKLAVIPNPTNQHVQLLAAQEPVDTLPDALMVLDKKTALAALERLTDEEREAALYQLSRQLDNARVVQAMIAERADKTKIRAMLQTRGQGYLVNQLMDTAKYYNPKRGMEVRRILDSAIRAHEAGAREGVLESVIAVW